MIIWPAIDLLNGNCVRLTKGEYDTSKTYNEDPVAQAEIFANAGLDHLHIVDLDGAKSGETENFELIKKMVQHSGMKVQVGGGIRDKVRIERYLAAGVSRVILGSSAVKSPEFLADCVTHFGPDKIVLGLDVRDRKIAIHGWTEESEWDLVDFLKRYTGINVLMTDIGQDGTLSGLSLELYKEVMKSFLNLNFIASGGVASLDDITGAQAIGMQDVIVGKAIYENKILLEDLVKLKDE